MNKKPLLTLVLAFAFHFCYSQVSLSLSPAKPTYLIGGEISINFSTSTPLNPGAWVGLYNASASHATSKGYLGYQYIPGVEKSVHTFKAPNEAGEYEFRVFDIKPEKEVASISFPVIEIDPREISLKQRLTSIYSLSNSSNSFQ